VMPVLYAARALGATLAGVETAVTFPVMPVSVKTPSLPVVVATSAPGSDGVWTAMDTGDDAAWRFIDANGAQTGFALLGTQTARRAEMLKAMASRA
jgi:rubredoxin---NAD+ reductase